jgi:hypothetical protein
MPTAVGSETNEPEIPSFSGAGQKKEVSFMSDKKDRVTEEKEQTQKTLDKMNIDSSTAETYKRKDTEDKDCMDRVEEAKEENQDKIEETA